MRGCDAANLQQGVESSGFQRANASPPVTPSIGRLMIRDTVEARAAVTNPRITELAGQTKAQEVTLGVLAGAL